MAPKPRIMRVSSQKGGVGKTVISVNLAIALSALKHKVLLVDEDLANPSVAIHLKFDDVNVGIRDVFYGNAKIDKAIVKYFPSSIDVLPGVVSEGESGSISLTNEQVDRVFVPLQKSSYEFIIIDTSPGILSERVLAYYKEILLITTPDLPSLTPLMRLSTIYDKHHIKNRFVVNKVTNEKQELSVKEIEGVLKQKAFGVLPSDPKVPESIEKQIPLYINDDDSPFARGIADLAKQYTKRFI